MAHTNCFQKLCSILFQQNGLHRLNKHTFTDFTILSLTFLDYYEFVIPELAAISN